MIAQIRRGMWLFICQSNPAVLEMSVSHTSAMAIYGQPVKFWIWAVLKLMRQLDDVSRREKVTQKVDPVIEGRWNWR